MKKDLMLFIVYGIIGFFGLVAYLNVLDAFYVIIGATFLIIASATHFKRYKEEVLKKNQPRRIKFLK
ncbi:hypothetical protein D3Z38_10385 [Clostridiales bacterium]|nr:hypothetical protein [Clostridiales bacterium]